MTVKNMESSVDIAISKCALIVQYRNLKERFPEVSIPNFCNVTTGEELSLYWNYFKEECDRLEKRQKDTLIITMREYLCLFMRLSPDAQMIMRRGDLDPILILIHEMMLKQCIPHSWSYICGRYIYTRTYLRSHPIPIHHQWPNRSNFSWSS